VPEARKGNGEGVVPQANLPRERDVGRRGRGCEAETLALQVLLHLLVHLLVLHCRRARGNGASARVQGARAWIRQGRTGRGKTEERTSCCSGTGPLNNVGLIDVLQLRWVKSVPGLLREDLELAGP
jgi:hypothetical protein